MLSYPWLFENTLDGAGTADKMRALNLAVAATCTSCELYSEDELANAADEVSGKTEAQALVAYLQSLGTSIKTRR